MTDDHKGFHILLFSLTQYTWLRTVVVKKSISRSSRILTFSDLLKRKIYFLQSRLGFCIRVCTCPSTTGQSLFIFSVQVSLHHRSVSGDYAHPSYKNKGPWIGPQNTGRWLSLKHLWQCRWNFTDFWRPYFLIKLHRWCPESDNGTFTGAQNCSVFGNRPCCTEKQPISFSRPIVYETVGVNVLTPTALLNYIKANSKQLQVHNIQKLLLMDLLNVYHQWDLMLLGGVNGCEWVSEFWEVVENGTTYLKFKYTFS